MHFSPLCPKTVATTLNFGELAGSGPYSGGGSDNESTSGGNGGSGNGNSGSSGGGTGNLPVSSSATSPVVSAADQVKSMLELQHNMPGSYGLYRPPYNNQPGTPDPTGFGGNRAGHLGGYPFAPMPGQNSYPGYHHLGYPTSQSPVRESKALHHFPLRFSILELGR